MPSLDRSNGCTESHVLSSPAVSSLPEAPVPPPPHAFERVREFDALRGIAILFVIYLHAFFGPWSTTELHERRMLYLSLIVANSAVPVFLFMSGFLSARDRSSTFSELIESRPRRVAMPLALWMIAALGFEVWLAGGLTRDLVQAFALFDIAGQFYYVLVLLVLTAALYPLRHVEDDRLKWVVIAAFAVNLAMIAYYQENPMTGFWWSIAYRNPLVWVFAFTFGLYIGRTRGHVRFSRAIITAAALGMVAIAGLYMLRGERTGEYPNSYFGVTVFLFGVLGFIVYPAGLRALDHTRLGRILLAPFVALAPYAFGIYLIHKPYFVGYLSDRLVTERFLEADASYMQFVIALFVVGAVGSIVAVLAMNTLFPRFSALMLGVEKPHPKPALPRD